MLYERYVRDNSLQRAHACKHYLDHWNSYVDLISWLFHATQALTEQILSFSKKVAVLPKISKFLLSLMDSQTSIPKLTIPKLTIPKAEALKRVGVQICVVGVGTYIYGIGEMVQMASSPQLLFRVKDYSAFVDVVILIIQEVASGEYVILQGQYKPPC